MDKSIKNLVWAGLVAVTLIALVSVASLARLAGTQTSSGIKGAGDTYQTPRMIEKEITSRTNTTSIQNTLGVTSTIESLVFYAQGDGTNVTSAIHMALSNDGIVATTDLLVSSTFAGGSGFTWTSTSTFPTISQRQFAPNKYIIFYTEGGTLPSTTEGFAAVKLFVP